MTLIDKASGWHIVASRSSVSLSSSPDLNCELLKHVHSSLMCLHGSDKKKSKHTNEMCICVFDLFKRKHLIVSVILCRCRYPLPAMLPGTTVKPEDKQRGLVVGCRSVIVMRIRAELAIIHPLFYCDCDVFVFPSNRRLCYLCRVV